MKRTESGRGRPHVSSRAVLEEAAYELFLEQGYSGTTVTQIARRAGVSRGTFFNYFPSKADVFWADVDRSLAPLHEILSHASMTIRATDAITAALVEVTKDFGPDRVPWVLTQFEAMGSPSEIRSSAVERFSRLAETLRHFIAERDPSGPDQLRTSTIAYAMLGAVFAAAQAWAAAGPSRGSLSEHVAQSLTTLSGSFR